MADGHKFGADCPLWGEKYLEEKGALATYGFKYSGPIIEPHFLLPPAVCVQMWQNMMGVSNGKMSLLKQKFWGDRTVVEGAVAGAGGVDGRGGHNKTCQQDVNNVISHLKALGVARSHYARAQVIREDSYFIDGKHTKVECYIDYVGLGRTSSESFKKTVFLEGSD